MSEIFYQKQNANFFDNMIVDVPKLYKDHPIKKEEGTKPNLVPFAGTPCHKIYQNRLMPLKYRRYAYHGLRRIGLDQSWFDEFKKYWSSILHGRPFWGKQDLFFLKNLYRVEFQNTQVPDTDDSNIHSQAWQRPELIYQLLHLVCKQEISDQLKVLQHLRKLRSDMTKLTYLEFGCATAPITASLYEFWKPKPELKAYISDIQTLAFHYAAHRFRYSSNVTPVLLTANNDFMLQIDKTFDVIFCITVFEHLNKPFETIEKFYDKLKPGGLLFFDYIKGDAEGLDTKQGVLRRNDVLNFVLKNFELVYGDISKDKSMDLTIIRKK